MLNKKARNQIIVSIVEAIAVMSLFLPLMADAAIVNLTARLDGRQEAFGGTDFNPARGFAFIQYDTLKRTFSYSLSVDGIFIRNFLTDADRIRPGTAFLDPAAPGYTSVHVHNNAVGQNGPIVIDAVSPPNETLEQGRIPASHPFRDQGFAGEKPAGFVAPKPNSRGFTAFFRNRPVPNSALSTPDGGPPVGPFVHDLNADGIIAQALAGRTYTNVHASFFDGRGELKGQNLPNALIRGQFIPSRRGRSSRLYLLTAQVANNNRQDRVELFIPGDDQALFLGNFQRGRGAGMLFSAGGRFARSPSWRFTKISTDRSANNDTSTLSLEIQATNTRNGARALITGELELDNPLGNGTAIVDDMRLTKLSVSVQGAGNFIGCNGIVGRYTRRQSLTSQRRQRPPSLDRSCFR